jgi:hypothetical protein
MKLLIIAGPYEADRIRKAAVVAGFETVAVEPGESLSGWITATRPELIVMAPQMVHADPATALSKVRMVPRGRVPIFLVGDAADEERMTGLAEGFFVRPVSAEALLDRARAILAHASAGSGPRRPRTVEGLGPVVPSGGDSAPSETTLMGVGGNFAPPPRPGTTTPGPAAPRSFTPAFGRPASGLRPLVSAPAAASTTVVGTARPGGDATLLLAQLSAGIDEIFEAELGHVLAAAPKAATGSPAPVETAAPAEAASEAMSELRREDTAPGGDAARSAPASVDRRRRLLAQHALVEEGDYFQILELPTGATGEDVRRAHGRLRAELDTPADEALARELSDHIEAIRAVLDEAARVLGDQRLRTRYAVGIG